MLRTGSARNMLSVTRNAVKRASGTWQLTGQWHRRASATTAGQQALPVTAATLHIAMKENGTNGTTAATDMIATKAVAMKALMATHYATWLVTLI